MIDHTQVETVARAEGWPIDDARIIPTGCHTVIVPYIETQTIKTTLRDGWFLEPPKIAFWADRFTFSGRIWRFVGRIFGSERLTRRGQFPVIEHTEMFAQETIELKERYHPAVSPNLTLGYGPRTKTICIYDAELARWANA
jgi:hypothetical protein